jgi:hypothetical protein
MWDRFTLTARRKGQIEKQSIAFLESAGHHEQDISGALAEGVAWFGWSRIMPFNLVNI